MQEQITDQATNEALLQLAEQSANTELFWNIAVSVSSFVLALIAVVVSVFTLWQNHKMIESSTRPYLGITGEFISYGTKMYKLVLKNFGNSEAYIESLTFTPELKNYASREDIEPFKRFVGSTILPNQSIVCELMQEKIRENLVQFIEAKVTYKDSVDSKAKPYKGTFSIPLGAFIDAPLDISGSPNDSSEQSLHHINATLQTMTDKML